MKRIFYFSIFILLSVFASAQIRTAEDVKNTFSSRNVVANHAEFDIQKVLGLYGIDNNTQGKIDLIKITMNDKNLIVYMVQNNQVSSVTALVGKGSIQTINKFLYNSNNQLEVAAIGKDIVAITYDKKGRVASEAFLVKASKSAKSDKGNITMTDGYAYTDQWKKHDLSDTTESIYLYEFSETGESIAWAIDRMCVYDYNSKGQMTKKIETSRDKVREAITEFTYKNGVLQQQVKTYSNTNMIESTVYTYEKGLLTKAQKGYYRYAAKRKVMELSAETNLFVYDDKGNLTEYTSNSGQRYDFCSMQYDAKNRITDVQKRQENGEMAVLFRCEYDANGNVVKSEKGSVVTTYQYEYDSNGNWTKQTVTKNNGNPVVTTREISYMK